MTDNRENNSSREDERRETRQDEENENEGLPAGGG